MQSMAKDFKMTQYGDLIINPSTHDFEMVDGIDEVAQRIRATLLIRYGEMTNLDPDQGMDYADLIGKGFNDKLASEDIESTIMAKVPEVQTINNISFKKLAERKLYVSFSATVNVDNGNNNIEELERSFELGN